MNGMLLNINVGSQLVNSDLRKKKEKKQSHLKCEYHKSEKPFSHFQNNYISGVIPYLCICTILHIF